MFSIAGASSWVRATGRTLHVQVTASLMLATTVLFAAALVDSYGPRAEASPAAPPILLPHVAPVGRSGPTETIVMDTFFLFMSPCSSTTRALGRLKTALAEVTAGSSPVWLSASVLLVLPEGRMVPEWLVMTGCSSSLCDGYPGTAGAICTVTSVVPVSTSARPSVSLSHKKSSACPFVPALVHLKAMACYSRSYKPILWVA